MARDAVAALDLANQPDDAIQRLQIARHHRRMGDHHGIVQPPDLRPHKARRRIDLARSQNALDQQAGAAHRQPFLPGDLPHRDARLQHVENAEITVGAPALRLEPRVAGAVAFRRGLGGGVGQAGLPETRKNE